MMPGAETAAHEDLEQEIARLLEARAEVAELHDALLSAVTLPDLDFLTWAAERHRVRDGDRRLIPSTIYRMERLAELGRREALAAERFAYVQEVARSYQAARSRARRLAEALR